MPRPEQRLAAAALLLGARALMGAGGYLAAELGRSHRPLDLAYSEGPHAFRAWLAPTWRAAPEGRETAAAIAKRLMSMPIAARRRTIAAMTDEAFWRGPAAEAAGRRSLQMKMREAVLMALQQAPAAGDLWLAAAFLRTILDGFDERAVRYLAASYRFAPGEGQVAYARAGLITHVLPLLDGRLAAAAEIDLALIEANYPQLKHALAPALQARENAGAGR